MSEGTAYNTTGRRALLVLMSGVLLIAFGWMLADDSIGAAESSDQAARIGDRTISMAEAEAEAKSSPEMEQLEAQRRQFETQFEQQKADIVKLTAKRMVEQAVLESEAAARGVSVDELIATEVTSKVEPVTEEAILAFFEARKQPNMQSVDPYRDQIRQILEQQGSEGVRTAFVSELETKYDAEVLIEEPRMDVAATGPSRGPENAPVTIIEFSDFQCPYCARVVPTLDRLAEEYPDQVRVVFRQFPLTSIHPQAFKAAEAALCANEQGKFWEMHDAMFENQRALGVPDLKTMAAGLGVDSAAFDQCLDAGTFTAQVSADLRDGQAAGVSGTPAMFVNGRFVNGAVPYDQLSDIVDEEIKRAARGR